MNLLLVLLVDVATLLKLTALFPDAGSSDLIIIRCGLFHVSTIPDQISFRICVNLSVESLLFLVWFNTNLENIFLSGIDFVNGELILGHLQSWNACRFRNLRRPDAY